MIDTEGYTGSMRDLSLQVTSLLSMRYSQFGHCQFAPGSLIRHEAGRSEL